MKERFLVTSALPYANGPLHIGHAIGAYIPADVYVRYLRLKGKEVIYICGTDEHGTPISVQAEKEGVTPKELVDKYHKIIKDTFDKLGISFDNFSRTTSKLHYELSREFFLKIMEKGYIYKKRVSRPYCKRCKRFLPDRYVRGICPECGAKDQRGDQCEVCGKQLEPHELKEAYCAICKEKPVMKETEHWFFKLSEFSEKLEQWILKNEHWPPNAKNFSLGWIKKGLEDRAITRDLDWGVPVPLEEAKGKVLYVWFDAPIGYISATKEWAIKIKKPEEWKKYWKDKGCKIVHFIGKDNIPFHAIIWPAMLMAHGGYNLPWQISSNEYLNLEGRKMSTSRGWVIWLHDILAKFPADYLRYYLIAINPSKHDADFSLAEFKEKVNNELISNFGNFVYRVLSFIKSRFDGKVPEPRDEGEVKAIEEKVSKIVGEVENHLENFRFSQALYAGMSLASLGNEYFQQNEPWKNEEKAKDVLFICANLTRTLAIVMLPFIPFSATRLLEMLNIKSENLSWDSAKKFSMAPGHEISEAKMLFRKISDEAIKSFSERYLKAKEDVAKKEITIEDFNKLDLRVGKIIEVKDHENADNLYVLKIDLGALGNKQVVAGLKRKYSKAELLGKKVVVIANLKAAKIRGVKSECMLLAATDAKGNPVLLIPEEEVPSGSKIK